MEGGAAGCGENGCRSVAGCRNGAAGKEEEGESAEGGEATEGGALPLLLLGGMYREVLDTARFVSGPDGCFEGWMVTMETAATGVLAMVRGLGCGGRNITEVTDARGEAGPGVKGRAVRFRTP